MSDTDLMTQVITWILIVLGAGFIGHFGKALAEHLLARARKKRAAAEGKEPQTVGRQPEETTPPAITPGISKSEVKPGKAQKKAQKAMLKMKKKEKK